MTSFTESGQADQTWRVGALARVTGLTIRTLRYYDEIGLLTPSRRSAAGHRLYDAQDLSRLYRVSLMRRLGFPLEQIATTLSDPRWQLAPAVDRHLSDARSKAAAAARLSSQLATMAAELAQNDDPSADQLFSILEEMAMADSTIHGTTGLLVYDDIDAAHDYIVQVFGLASGLASRDATDKAEYREVLAGERAIGLHPSSSTKFRSPQALGAVTGMTVIAVDDADAHYARCVAAGAQIVQEPVDQPYGIREYGAQDPEGQLWYFHSPLD
jgi:MerR family transcriptional regulator, thiopeptide resistance regulator